MKHLQIRDSPPAVFINQTMVTEWASETRKRIGRWDSLNTDQNSNFQESFTPMRKGNSVTPAVHTIKTGKRCGGRIELLILKARRTLEQCPEELSVNDDDSSCSLDKLEVEISWEHIAAPCDSPLVHAEDSPQQRARAKCAHLVLANFLSDDQSGRLSGNSHLHPAEALKPMLLNLQAEQESFDQNKTK